ncbi:VanW family protein [Actinocrinis puniceicyclus]|uniref:VanW family protein n=1 Tax=Actinocrinis puniceicyclus TaxID=977794 RepID=A0A8J7WJI1_9ACTN|nr:VanW family protein [Actinocrinis puniceicyclus]MBS2962478.1 VanW family protein [Actinocrinis puniceicyclus]
MNAPESTDYPARGTDPRRRDAHDPQLASGQREQRREQAAFGGATDLLDFPPLPRFPDPADPGYNLTPFPDPLSDSYGGYLPVPQPDPAPPDPASRADSAAPQPEGLRVSSASEATARLVIKLPPTPPQPSTTLRPHAPWEDLDGDAVPQGVSGQRRDAAPATPFAQVAASPARPSALPSELAALTTATLVVPLPHDTRPTAALLTTTLPPDQAAQANAAALAFAFNDTLEQVFGLDLEKATAAQAGLARATEGAAGAESALDRASLDAAGFDEADIGVAAAIAGEDLPAHWFRDEPADRAAASDPAAGGFTRADQAPYEYVPGVVPSSGFGGRYGVPTQPAVFPGVGGSAEGHDSARHALALRYLGGIFHNSSGESAYLDPGSPTARALRGPAGAPAAGRITAPDAPTQQLRRIPAKPAARPSAPASAPMHAPAAVPEPVPTPAPAATPVRAPAPAPAAKPVPSHAVPSHAVPSHAVPSHAARSGSGSTKPGHPEEDGTEAGSARHPGSRLLTAAAVVAGACALLYGIALAVASGVFDGGVPHGTVVAGVPIGGLSPVAAEQVLDERLGPASRAPIPLVIGQTPAELDPVASGLSLDSESTVRAARQARTDPFVIIPALFGATHQVAPVPRVDEATLSRALETAAASYGTPMVEGSIRFHQGVPVVTAPREGRKFSVAGATTAIRNGYLRVDGPILIPVQLLEPKATSAALQSALDTIARPAVSAPIELITGADATDLTPSQIGDALTIAPDTTGRMTARLDGTRLRGYLSAKTLAQEQPAVNASFVLDHGRPVLVPARDGRGFAPAALADAVLPALTASAPRKAQASIGPLPADLTTAAAQALGITDVLGSDTLPVADATNRAANVQRATSLVAGGIVPPGATWSFLRTVGTPSAANGFVVSAAAQRAGIDPSGGVDTVATAVFDAAFAAGMGDVQHHPHAAYIDRYPVGLDAAVVAPGTDLQWANTGDHPVYLYASYANRSLTVALLGEKSYDDVSIQVSQRTAVVQPSPSRGSCTQAGAAGFQVAVTRTLLRGGGRVGTEEFHVTYLPQNPAGCSGGTSSGPSARRAPTNGSGTDAKQGHGGGSGGNTGGGSGSAPSSSPSPSQTGILGGLLH